MHATTRDRFGISPSVLRMILAMLLPLLGAGCCTCVPAELRVDGPVVARVHATGFQVYTWEVPAGWKFKAPEATFEGKSGLKGTHGAGPNWTSTTDGSKVLGHKIAEHPAKGDAVPWLLLEATGHEGNGVLSGVTYIQRLKTTGGKAPAAGGSKVGDEARVPYTADYVFFGPDAKPKTAAR